MKPIRHLHRPFGLLLAVLASAWFARGDMSPSATAPSIAFVGAFAESDDDSFQSFRAAMLRAWPSRIGSAAAGFNLRYFQGSDVDPQRLRDAIASAAASRPAVIVLPSGDHVAAASALRVEPPLVFASFPDPLRQGTVESLRRPGRNTTGVALGDSLDLKRLELLRDAFPHVGTVAMLVDNSWLANEDTAGLIDAAARHLGLRVEVRVADTLQALEQLMQTTTASACDAWYIPPTYIADLAAPEIAAALRRLHLPAIHASEREVAAGALMAYSQDTRFAYDALAQLATRVALGEDAGTIPIQRPYRYTLSVLIEPDALWARIDPSVVRRADRVYQP